MKNAKKVIYLDHLRHNIGIIRSLIPTTARICLAVKADGYGHGAVEIAKTAAEEGVTWFGVANVEEGTELREAGIKGHILSFSLVLPADIPRLIEYAVTPIIADRGFLRLLQEHLPSGKAPYPVHCMIDTGMGRIGCSPETSLSLSEEVARTEKVSLEGICTHFARADTADQTFSREQLRRFLQAVSTIRNSGINPGLLHAANSGAVIGLPESHFDMVRPGIMAYGYYPSREQERKFELKPVMEFVTKVVYIKEVEKNTPISYGSVYRTTEKTKIATLAAGYGDGYFRMLSNTGKVLINGKLYPVAGRVTMDQIMVDLGPESDVSLYDDAVLFGPTPGAPSAEDIADLCGTIPYEITCALSKRVYPEYR